MYQVFFLGGPMSTDELLTEYTKIMNSTGGPNSDKAIEFREKHSGNEEFQSLAKTAGFLWNRINHKET